MYLMSRLPSLWISAVAYFLLGVSVNSQVRLPDVSSLNIYCQQKADLSTISGSAPPNNTIVDDPGECDIYNRAEQMFFWLTSAPPADDGGSYVFTSSIFYAVSQPRDGRRSLLRQRGAGAVTTGLFDVALSQTGPNGVPVVFDKTGNPHDIRRPRSILNDVDSKVEIQRIVTRPPAFPLFFDINGKMIKYGKIPKMFDAADNWIKLSVAPPMIVANGVRYSLDVDGNAVDYGVGQAETHKALMTQKGRLVYYGILVNDVYASYYRSMPTNPPTEFPTKIDDLIRDLPDAKALAVALKTAWIKVEKNEIEDYKKRYLIIDANIPTYVKRSNYCLELEKKTEPATLALVGMHVTFSTVRQPKMIWATFEHIGNTRNKSYEYFSNNNKIASHEDSKGNWLFSKNAKGNDGYNLPRMHVNSKGDIIGDDGDDDCNRNTKYQKTIGPSNIRRDYAWGSENATANTNLILVNRNFMTQLPPGDVRRNYIMIGATWFGNTAGGTKLGNSTMETFTGDSQCLACHNDTYLRHNLSHIWRDLSK
jgi:hypothetical protein